MAALQISEHQPTSGRLLPESFCATLDDDSGVQPSDHGLETETMVTETQFPAVVEESELQFDDDSEDMVPQSPLDDFDDEADVYLSYKDWKAKYLHLLLILLMVRLDFWKMAEAST